MEIRFIYVSIISHFKDLCEKFANLDYILNDNYFYKEIIVCFILI